MKRSSLSITLLSFVIFTQLLFTSGLVAQTDPAMEEGIKAFGSYQGGDLDSVSTTTGKLVVHIPLWSYPQRGGRLHVDFMIQFNSQAFTFKCDKNDHCVYNLINDDVPLISANLMPLGLTGKDQFNGTTYLGTLWTLKEGSGQVHQMGALSSGTQLRAVDVSGWLADITTWNNPVVYDSNGNSYSYGSSGNSPTVKDLNGNSLTWDANGNLIDTVGRNIPSVPSPPVSGSGDGHFTGCSTSATSEKDWIIPDQGTGTVTIKLCWGSGFEDIVLPNLTKYTLTFQKTLIGGGIYITDLAQIALPTGGTISYTYSNALTQCSDTEFYRQVATRTVDDGTGNPQEWQYAYQLNNSPYTTTITDPLLNVAVHTMTVLTTGNWNGICSPYETEYQQKDGSGNVLKTVDTGYSFWPAGSPYFVYEAVSVVPNSVQTTWPNAQQKRTTTTYGPTFQWYALVRKNGGGVGDGPYTAYYSGNPYSVGESDYGTTNVLRTTSTSYVALPTSTSVCSGSVYCGENLLNLKQSVSVSGTGNSSSTTYNYDEGGTSYPGNLTSIHKSLNLPPTDVVSSMTYTAKGMVATSVDPNKNPATTYTYDSTGMFLKQVKDPAGHITLFSYDANTGELNSTTDPNGKLTQYTYDNMRRLASVTYPASDGTGNGGGALTYVYDDNPGSLSVEAKHTMDGTNSTDEFVLFDGLGRETSLSKANGEVTPWDKTDICYDGLGRKIFASYPYQASSPTASQVCTGGDSYTYDALNRVRVVTHSDGSTVTTAYSGAATSVSDEGNGTKSVQRISQVDGLGRLISVCEMSPTTLSYGLSPAPISPCNSYFSGAGFPTTYQYDALGNLTTVTQGSLNARSFSYDSLSRLLTASNPESGITCYGTWSSGYNSVCNGGYDKNGNMTKRTMLAPNQTLNSVVTTTYSYDALNHLISKTYSDGSTPGSYYNYDQVLAFGNSLNNGAGRLTSEGVSANGGSSWINSAEFSYDPMGRVISNWQSVPTQYNMTYGYDFIGDITSLVNGTGVTFTPEYNVAARITALNSSWSPIPHPPLPLSSVTYSAWGTPTAATFGNGVTETRQYTARGWLSSQTDSGFVYSSGVQASGKIQITGGEGSNAQSTATFQITGTQQNRLKTPATQSTGIVSISGTDACADNQPISGCHTWDTGTVTISINGYSKFTAYQHSSTNAGLAQALANQFLCSSGSPVSATTDGQGTITFTSCTTGSSTNYGMSGSVKSDNIGITPGFILHSGWQMQGGQDAVYTYDAGTVTLTVTPPVGNPYSAIGYFGNGGGTGGNNTPALVAASLANSLNASGGLVTATSDQNGYVTVTSVLYGANTTYTLTNYGSSSTVNPSFVPPSFQFVQQPPPPAALSGGRDPAGSTKLYDAGSGSVTVTVNGTNYPASVSYGQNSTLSNIAGALASAINNSGDNGVDFNAASNGVDTVTITASRIGSNYDYAVSEVPLSSSKGFNPPSFSMSALTALGGGQNPGNIPGIVYSLGLSYAPNGDVSGVNDLVNGNWTYGYDDMNRLLTSTCGGGGCLGSYSYYYDRFGNRWWQHLTGGHGLDVPYSFDANNRITGSVSYDAPGNVTFDGVNYYKYDAENRIIGVGTSSGSSNIASYVYDAEGRRANKTTAGGTLSYIFDLAGHQLAELTSSGTVNRREIYAGGIHLGTYSGSTTYFHHGDWLGTERVRSDMTAMACEAIVSLPFGDGQTTSGSCGDPSPMHFTGKQRDTESGLDYFGARYDGSSLGRFVSPDPLMSSATVYNPQTWNRYAYALNNPVKYVDPTGLIEESPEDCAKDKQCVTVKLNIIYDQKANLSDEQKEDFNNKLLQEAKNEYGDAHISLDVTYTAGGYDDKGNLHGASKDSLNVVVSDFTPTGDAGVSQVTKSGYAVTQINVNQADRETLAHELAHQFSGDTTGLINSIVRQDPTGILGQIANAFADVSNDAARNLLPVNAMSPHLGRANSITRVDGFNAGARDLQNMLNQQSAIRPRQ